MKYAVIKLAGKQYTVTEGSVFELERQPQPLSLHVLAYSDSSNNLFGKPYLANVGVSALVIKEKRDRKIRVARFKPKSRYDKVNGHKQPLSVVKIEKIELSNNSDARESTVEVIEDKKPVKVVTTKAKVSTKVTKVAKTAKVKAK